MKKAEMLSGRDDTIKFFQHVKLPKEGYALPMPYTWNLLLNDNDVTVSFFYIGSWSIWQDNIGE